MFVWVTAAALMCAVACLLGIPSISPFAITGQSIALLVMAVAGMFLFGAFEALETEAKSDTEKP